MENFIIIISNPLSTNNRILPFKVSSTREGDAGNAFGVDYGFDGRHLRIKTENFI
jgi:hypothetical protein